MVLCLLKVERPQVVLIEVMLQVLDHLVFGKEGTSLQFFLLLLLTLHLLEAGIVMLNSFLFLLRWSLEEHL